MNNNLYWSIYKNLEKEIIDISNVVHFDDDQLEIYSIKITELLIRTVVEVESISKELYFQQGGTKPNNKELFFDTDCLALLESKWLLSKKQVFISNPNFYFYLPENKVLTPLKKSFKRGTSSSDWQRAYQAIKHNRAASIKRGNLKNLIRSMGSLFILNLYYKNDIYQLEKNSKGTNFDDSIGSALFSIKLHISSGININGSYSKNQDFDECVYLLRPTSDIKNVAVEAIKTLNDKTTEKTKANIIDEMNKQIPNLQYGTKEEIHKQLVSIGEKIKTDNFIQVAKENNQMLKNAFENLEYEAVLNLHQY